MHPREWRNIDKASWPSGPWHDEPDGRLWEDPATLLPCIVVRHPDGGFLCGYVGIAPAHRWYPAARTGYRMEPSPLDREIVSLGSPKRLGGEATPEGYRWVGFGCGEARDFKPALDPVVAGDPASYVDFAAATLLTGRLAEAVAAEMAHVG